MPLAGMSLGTVTSLRSMHLPLPALVFHSSVICGLCVLRQVGCELLFDNVAIRSECDHPAATDRRGQNSLIDMLMSTCSCRKAGAEDFLSFTKIIAVHSCKLT